MNLSRLNEIELQFRVERLLAAYAHCIDDDHLEQWPSYFVDKCLYKIIARENVDRGLPLATMFCDSKAMLADRITSLRHANIYEAHHYRHVLSSILITDTNHDTVVVKSNYAIIRTRSNGESTLYSTGQYQDVIVVEEELFKFKEKIVIYDTSRIDSALVIPI